MTSLNLNPQILTHLEFIEGQSPDEKLLSLLETYLKAQLRACEQEISEYEIKYRSTFDEFAEAWELGKVPNQYSHSVERDYMEWEGLIADKERWLKRLQELPSSDTLEQSRALPGTRR